MPASIEAKPFLWSKGFGFWKEKEQKESGRISLETVVSATGLSRNTVRRFLDPNADVSGATLGAAYVMAEYLDTDLAALVSKDNNQSVPGQEISA